jgi:membrane-bound lytic murein transglycosylase MltF
MRVASIYIIAQLAAKDRPSFYIPWRPMLMQYTALYDQAAQETASVDPCMLAAIVNHESLIRHYAHESTPPGPGCGVGLCRISSGVDWSTSASPTYPGFGDPLDPLTNLRIAATNFLQPALEQFPYNHIAAFAAYNLGIDAVQQEIAQRLDPDERTTGGNYGHAVFTDWINFAATSRGYTADWSTWKDMNARSLISVGPPEQLA